MDLSLGNIIVFIWLFVSIILMAQNNKIKELIILTTVGIVICPPLRIGTIWIPFHYFGVIINFFMIIKLYLVKNKDDLVSLKINNVIVFFVFYIFYTLLIGSLIFISGKTQTLLMQSYIGLIVNLSWIILISIYFTNYDRNTIIVILDKVIFILLVSNLVAIIIQVGWGLPELFYKLYYKPSLTPLELPLSLNRFTRAFGLFGSPINLSALSLIALAYSLSRKNIINIILSIVIGITSLTKTAIIGIPLIIIFYITLKICYDLSTKFTYNKKQRRDVIRYIYNICIIIASAFVLLSLINILKRNNFYVDYYLSYLTKPFEAFSSRYNINNDEILLGNTYKAISRSPLVGTGYTIITNEFMGDSTYILILKTSGIIGLLTYLFMMIYNIILLLRRRSMFALIPIVILLIGFSIPAFNDYLFVTLLQGVLYLNLANSEHSICINNMLNGQEKDLQQAL